MAKRIDPSKKEVVKVAIPSPTMVRIFFTYNVPNRNSVQVHFRGGRSSIDIAAYPNLDEFFEDLAAAYREEIKILADAGCKYLQVCSPKLIDA